MFTLFLVSLVIYEENESLFLFSLQEVIIRTVFLYILSGCLYFWALFMTWGMVELVVGFFFLGIFGAWLMVIKI